LSTIMGLMGNGCTAANNNIENKKPAIVVVKVNPNQGQEEESLQRKTIKMDKHVKAVKVTAGNDVIPKNDDPRDNLFLALYKDPLTTAPVKRTIYLSRHGESQYNLYGKIGGDSGLSSQGLKYALKLAAHFEQLKLDNFQFWTSELIRTHQTTQHFDSASRVVKKQLNEISSGDFDGMTYEDVAEKHPIEFADRDNDKLRYRYPNGESYVDVCRRLCEILPEMNRSHNLLIVSHQAVVRCIYTYLMRLPIDQLPYVKIPLHTVMKVTFDGAKNVVESTFMNIECVDTHRSKPTNCGVDRNFVEAIQTVPQHL